MSTAPPNRVIDLLKRGLMGGVGFGAAMTLVHLVVGVALIIALGMPPMNGFVAQSVVMELLLGVVLGTALFPVYKLPRGEWIHPVLMTLVFIAMERVVAVDPSKLQMWIGPSLGGMAVFSIGRALWAKRPRAVIGALVGLPIVAMIAPNVAYNLRPTAVVPRDAVDAPEGAPDVLFIVMDTVRAQSSSAYGYERETTPVLQQLADEGLIFMDANAPATWSLPAHAALFTGTFPSYNNAHGETRYLDANLPTLAETLGAAGWETRCFSANPHISDSFGLTRGFMANDKAWSSGAGGRGFSFIYRFIDVIGLGGVEDKGGATVVGNIEDWMERRPDDGRPAFVFVNFLEAHFPFHQLPDEFLYEYQQLPIGELREAGQIAFGVQFGRQLTDAEYEQVHQPLTDMYDAGILYTDYLVGQVIESWRKKGMLDNTIVVVLGDHGEVMGEHRAFGHVSPVVEEDLRVPYVFRYPKRIPAGSKVTRAVSTVGTFATIMDLLDLPPPPIVQIDTLMPGLDGGYVGQPVLAERFEEEMLAARFEEGTSNGVGPLVNPRGRYRTFRSGKYKLVQHSEGGVWLYDLKADPGELNDLAPTDPTTVAKLTAELADWQRQLALPDLDAAVDAPRGMPEGMTEEETQALCALGYLSGEECD